MQTFSFAQCEDIQRIRNVLPQCTAEIAPECCDEHMSVCVCLSVSEYISETTSPIFTKFILHVTYGRGSVLLW